MTKTGGDREMIYRARYGKDGYEKAIVASIREIGCDNYYAMYGYNGEGTQILHRRGGGSQDGWGEYFLSPGPLAPKEYQIPDKPNEGFIKTHMRVQWLACSGNLVRYEFDHAMSEVILVIESRRHGIPNLASDMTGVEPIEVLEYKTQEPTWKWWETADNNNT